MSSPQVNVGWSAANTIAGVLLLRRGVRSPGEAIGAAVGAVAMALVVSYHFGDVLAGGRGLRGVRAEHPTMGDSGPPQSLVKATEPELGAIIAHVRRGDKQISLNNGGHWTSSSDDDIATPEYSTRRSRTPWPSASQASIRPVKPPATSVDT